jgi:GTPase SAR1 family protein
MTKNGLISFTNLAFANNNSLIIVLISQNLTSTSENATKWSQSILYHIRNLLIVHVGIKDYEEDLSKNIFERLKKQLRILEPTFDSIFSNNNTIDDKQHIALKPEFLFNSLQMTTHN